MSVKKNKALLKQGTLFAALLGCSALYTPVNAEAAAVSAKTSWAVSRVASETMGSYCTMAQKYSDDTVLTFARNTNDEYSLALDYKDSKFKAGQKQSVSISVDGGKEKTFSVTAQSDNTAVLSIGSDADFIKKIASANKLTVGVGKDTSDFAVKDFKSGQKEMGVCIEALQKPATPNKADEKIVVSSAATSKEAAIEPSADAKEPSVEGLLAAMPNPSTDIKPVEDSLPVIPAKAKTAAKVDKVIQVEKSDHSDTELASLRDENAKLSRALQEQRKEFENKQSSADSAAMNEIRAKLDAENKENQSLRAQLDKANADVSVKTKDTQSAAKLNDTVLALQQENQTLKNQLQIYANTKDKKSADTEMLAQVQAENANLKQQISDLKSAQKNTVVATADAPVDDEVLKLRNNNRQLSSELDLLKADYDSLKKQAASFQKDLESKQMKMAGGSWDLEQATRRYQESQREIVRLGAILQSQDVKCANEKKDIEYMLFDPAIATKAQISMLNSMEDQIKEKDAKLKSFEAELAQAKAQASPDKDAQIAQLQKSVDAAKNELSDKTKQLADAQAKIQQAQVAQADLSAKDQTLASLKADMAKQAQQLADAQAKLKDAQVAQADVSAKDQTLAALKADMAKQAQQLADAQAKLKDAQVAQADVSTKDQTLAALKADMAKQAQELADAQTKIAQATQAQAAANVAKDAQVEALKAQLTQAQSQLVTEQAKVQQANFTAQSQQSAEQAASMAALQLQIQQANQKIIQLQNQISNTHTAALKAASIAPAAAPIIDAAQAEDAAASGFTNASYTPAAVSVAHFKSMDEFSTLLKSSGVDVNGPLKQIQGGNASNYRAYSWKTNSLYGSAEMKKISDSSQFDASVTDYLNRAKSRCSGEFAAVLSPTKAAGMEKSKAFEIACVGQGTSSSASVLFTYGNQIVTTIAHEGRAEAMDLAIDARDKVSSKIN